MKSRIEMGSLMIGGIANLVMAAAGWIAFYFSGSEALLLDGNFSFILFITGVAAVGITLADRITKKKKSLEMLYIVIKGLLILFVIVIAVINNIQKIYEFILGHEVGQLKTGIIGYYIALVVTICFSLSFFYRNQNQKINNTSRLLDTEAKASMIDGFMSSGTGIALIFVGLIEPGSSLNFMLYIGDSIAVLLLSICMVKEPIIMIFNAITPPSVHNVIPT